MPRKPPAAPKHYPNPFAELHLVSLSDLLLDEDERRAVHRLKHARRIIRRIPELVGPLGLTPPRRAGRPRGSHSVNFLFEAYCLAIAVDWCDLRLIEALRACKRDVRLVPAPWHYRWLSRRLETGRPWASAFLREPEGTTLKARLDSLDPTRRKKEGKAILKALTPPA